MRLVVNGEPHEVEPGSTLSALLDELGVEPRRVAVLLNDEVVAAEARAAIPLQADDRVEVLTFAGGG